MKPSSEVYKDGYRAGYLDALHVVVVNSDRVNVEEQPEPVDLDLVRKQQIEDRLADGDDL